jgi:hypothetical protein
MAIRLPIQAMTGKPGIRVSDAIEWARTILERYEGPGAPPTMLTIHT